MTKPLPHHSLVEIHDAQTRQFIREKLSRASAKFSMVSSASPFWIPSRTHLTLVHVLETRTAGDRSLPGDPVREKQHPAVLRRADHPPAKQNAQKLLLRGFRALTAPTLTRTGALARTGTTTGHVDLLDLFG